MVYRTKGTCSTKIDLDMDQDHIIRSVRFTGGCDGNLQGISKLVVGRKAEDVIESLEGIRCDLLSGPAGTGTEGNALRFMIFQHFHMHSLLHPQ